MAARACFGWGCPRSNAVSWSREFASAQHHIKRFERRRPAELRILGCDLAIPDKGPLRDLPMNLMYTPR
jgi:hypothetical protein